MKLFVYDISNSDTSLKIARDRLADHVFGSFFDDEVPPVVKNEHGKPGFAPPNDNIYFNISHSGDLVVMAIGEHPVGVDVERIGRAKDHLKLARRFYYEHENERVLNAENSEEEFYRIWTFREAFSKLIGDGLAIFGKKVIEIDYEGNRVSYEGEPYVFYEYDIKRGYRLTVCVPEAVSKIEIMEMDL